MSSRPGDLAAVFTRFGFGPSCFSVAASLNVNVSVWGREIKKVPICPDSERLGPDPSLPIAVSNTALPAHPRL